MNDWICAVKSVGNTDCLQDGPSNSGIMVMLSDVSVDGRNRGINVGCDNGCTVGRKETFMD